MKGPAATAAWILMTASTALGGNAHYPDNQPPLKPKPFTALPLGSVHGAPFGISLLGPANSDRALIGLGRRIMGA